MWAVAMLSAIAGTLEPSVPCAGAGEITYALYQPRPLAPGAPVLVVLDPAPAEDLLARFVPTADRFGLIVVSPNGALGEDLGTRWTSILADVARRTDHTGAPVFVAGLGSGARAAWALAVAEPQRVVGVLGVGASTPSGIAPRIDPGFAWYGTADVLDFNHAEGVNTVRALQVDGAPVAFEPTHTGPGWPTEPTLTRGLGFLVSHAEAAGRLPVVPGRSAALGAEVLAWAQSVRERTATWFVLATWPGLTPRRPAWVDDPSQRRFERRQLRVWGEEIERRTRVRGLEDQLADPRQPLPTLARARRVLALAQLDRHVRHRDPVRRAAAQRMRTYVAVRLAQIVAPALETRGYDDRADMARTIVAVDPD